MSLGITTEQARRLDALSGGLCHLAENILNEKIGATRARELISTLSSPLGEDEKTQQSLAAVCAEILGALHMAGALVTKDGAKTCDFESLGAFCLGVLRWPPEQYAQAGIQEAALAVKGYRQQHAGNGPVPPSALFLEDMARIYPDKL